MAFKFPTWGEIRKQLTVSLFGLILTIPLSVIGQKALADSHWLDPVAGWVTEHLGNMGPNSFAWIVAGLVSLALYALLLWRVWKPHGEAEARLIPLKEALAKANERLRTRVSYRPLQLKPPVEIEAHLMWLFRQIDDLKYCDERGRPVEPGEVEYSAAYISRSELERAIAILNAREGSDDALINVAGSKNQLTGNRIETGGGGRPYLDVGGDENVVTGNDFRSGTGGMGNDNRRGFFGPNWGTQSYHEAPAPFQLTDDLKREILQRVQGHDPVVVESYQTARSKILAAELEAFLRDNGLNVGGSHVMMSGRPPSMPITIGPGMGGVMTVIVSAGD